MNTKQDNQSITDPDTKTFQANIYSKADPRDDGMLDSVFHEESKTKNNIDKENSNSEKNEQNQIIQEINIPSQNTNNFQLIALYTPLPIKNNFDNKFPANNQNNFVYDINNTKTDLTENKNLGNVYYGPYNGNISSTPTKIIINGGRKNRITRCRDSYENCCCGIF